MFIRSTSRASTLARNAPSSHCGIALALLLIGIASCAPSRNGADAVRDLDTAFNIPVPLDSARFREVLSIDGRYINDHTLIRAGDRWHLFYTEGEISTEPWNRAGNESRIGH